MKLPSYTVLVKYLRQAVKDEEFSGPSPYEACLAALRLHRRTRSLRGNWVCLQEEGMGWPCPTYKAVAKPFDWVEDI